MANSHMEQISFKQFPFLRDLTPSDEDPNMSFFSFEMIDVGPNNPSIYSLVN